MRVLHIDSGREMRGGQRQVLMLMNGQRSAGDSPVLLSPAGSPLFVEAHQAGLDVRELSVAALSRNAPGMDLIHAHDARAHTLGLTICRLPLIVSRRVAFPAGTSAASRWKYSRADHFIAISNYAAGCLKQAGVAAGKITVVYDGVEVPSSPASGDLVVSPASRDPRKKSSLAAEAARLAGFELLLSHDLSADLPRARLFVYLSDQEGLGSAALLASAYGIPVIASDVGGLREAVVHGETGLLVENQADDVARCIRLLSEDPAKAGEMGAKGRERALRMFTTEAMVRGTKAVYQRLLP
jgi:glycosyltransferase involved in cell wall biosynthesis